MLATVASAQVETYRIDLNVDQLNYGSVFGVNSAPYTFSITFTFDLTAHPHLGIIPQESMGTTITTGNWYAFGVESITAISGSFGTKQLLTQDLDWNPFLSFEEEEPENAPRYVFLADTDLTTTPTFVKFRFEFPDGSHFGFGRYDGDDSFIASLDATDINNDATAAGSGFSLVRLTAVPEPSTYAAIAGVCALGLAVWHRRRGASRSQR